MSNIFSVLIADDEINSIENITALLKKYPNFKIDKVASNGKEALEAIKNGSFDLAFLDIGMPELTGIEVIQELEAQDINLPYIVFITAFSHLGAQAYDVGAIDYIVKPASASRLQKTMDKFNMFTQAPEPNSNNSINKENAFCKEYNLTQKEMEICRLIKAGLTKGDLKNELNLSEGTIKTHLTHIYDKTELSSISGSGRSDKFSRLLFLLFNN